MYLIVNVPFGIYNRGDQISDSILMAQVLASPYSANVVEVNPNGFVPPVLPDFVDGFLALGTGTTSFVEMVGSGYARQSITMGPLVSGAVANSEAATFNATGVWPSATQFALCDINNVVLMWWQNNSPFTLTNGGAETVGIGGIDLSFPDLFDPPFASIEQYSAGTQIGTAQVGSPVTANAPLQVASGVMTVYAGGGVISVGGQTGNVAVGPLATAAVGAGIILNAGTASVVPTTPMNIVGTYNATTNTPAIATAGTGAGAGANNAYLVTTSGSVSVDTIGTVSVSDFIINTGSKWVRAPLSTIYGSMATQNANSIAATGGSITGQSTVGLTSGEKLLSMPIAQPDFSHIIASDGTNISAAMDNFGTMWVQALKLFTSLSAPGVQSPSFGMPTGETLSVIGGTISQPDLGQIVAADSQGNMAIGVDTNGTTVAQAMEVFGQVRAQSFVTSASTPGSVVTAPSDALDVTAYGAVGDMQRDVLLASFTNGGTVVTLGKYSGSVAVSGTNTLQLSGLTIGGGRSFDAFDVGSNVYIQATDGSGVNTTLPISGFNPLTNAVTLTGSITNAMTSAAVVWPVPTSADVGKVIRVDGGQAQVLRPPYDSGKQPWMGTIAAVSGNTITVGGTISGFGTLSTTSPGLPTDIAWGTDNTNAIQQAGLDLVTKGMRKLHFPRKYLQGRTGYGAFRMAWRKQDGANNTDAYFFLWNVDCTTAVNLATWTGDPNVHGLMTDVSGRPLFRHIVPGSLAIPNPRCDLSARTNAPRLSAIANGGTVQVMETGDSLSRYDPVGQSFAWFDMDMVEQKLRDGNPGRLFTFKQVSANGLGWAETVAPANISQWLLSGTDLFWLGSGGYNDHIKTNTAQKIMKAVTQIRALPADGHGNPPDVLFSTHVPKPENLVGSGICNYWEVHTVPALIRGIANWQGRGWTDLTEFGDLSLNGASDRRRAMIEVPPPAALTLSASNPLQINRRGSNFSISMSFTAASGSDLWTGIGKLLIPMSPQPGNVLTLDNDPITNRLRYKYDLWGQTFNGVTITSSGSLISAPAPTTSTGTLSWPTSTNILSMSSAPFTGTQGQCLYLPGCDTGGQTLRTVIDNVINSGVVVVQDVNCTALGGTQTNYVAGTTIGVGSLSFIQDDADSQTNIGIVNSGGTILYYGTITALTNQGTVSVTPTPPALAGTVCSVWLGHSTTGWQVASNVNAAAGGATQGLSVALKNDQLTVGQNNLGYFFRATVPHWGDDFYPTISATGAGVSLTVNNLFSDASVLYAPIGTTWETWGFQGSQSSGSLYGGDGGHYGSKITEMIHKPVLDAANFRAA